MGVLVLLVLAALALGGRRDGAAPAPTNGAVVQPVGEVKDLAVVATNQIAKLPGDVVGVTRISFQYKGPMQTLFFGWGLETQGGFLGTGAAFESGDNLIASPQRAWAFHMVGVKASTTFAPYSFAFTEPVASYLMPDPRVAQFGRDGRSLGIKFGEQDMWTWLASGAAIFETTTPTELLTFPPSVTFEGNFLTFATVPNVYRLLEPATEAAAQQLNIAFV